jgi:AcrR family transcriptional regulator
MATMSRGSRTTVSSPAALDLALLATGLPAAPPPELDPYLDAAARCFSRHGMSRTSVPDIARELGMSRTTVYRQIGTVGDAGRLLFARELRRLVEDLRPHLDDERSGPQILIQLITTVVRRAQRHPVLSKVLADEPEVVDPFVTSDLAALVSRITAAVTPVLEIAMRSGLIAQRRPEAVAQWLVRMTISLIVAPPPGDLDALLAEMIEPTLTPLP